MAKKKTALSALDKAFAIAGRFPSMVPGEFREELVRFRSRHKDKAAFLGLKESPAEKVTVTPENRDFLERVQKKENDMEYVAVMRDLTLGVLVQSEGRISVPAGDPGVHQKCV